jgi:hypothetical protein
MNVVEKIALDCGVKISEPHTDRSFMPISYEKYIIFDTRCSSEAGKYDFYQDVLNLIKPHLKDNNVNTIQICTDKDYKLSCDKTFIKINKKQEAYLISKSDLLICNQNYSAYLSSALNKKSLSLYSVFDPRNIAPVWNKDKQILIESDRDGNMPSYNQLSESPKTINFINPYEVAAKILNALEIKNSFDEIELVHIGESYNQQIVEIVPDFVSEANFLKGNSINLRLDLVKEMNGEVFRYWLSNKKVNLLTNKDLNIGLLKMFKANIIGLTVMLSEDISENFLKASKSLGLNVSVYCSEKEALESYRLKFFDWDVEKDFNEEIEIDKIKNLNKNSKYVSAKTIFSKGKSFPSKAAYLANKPLDKDGNDVILNEEFEQELEYFKIYNEEKSPKKR